MRRSLGLAALALLFVPAALTGLAAADRAPYPGSAKDWTAIVEVPVPPKRGKERPPQPACLWLPEGVEKVRGLYYPGTVIIEKKLAMNPKVRAALAELDMGILYYPLGAGLIHGGGAYLEHALSELAKTVGRPEVEFAPMLTAGHSAAGLFCRNVAYWKPHRVIAVVMIKSGNFHHAIEDTSRSLRTVPLIHFSGEFEEYGPEGGDLGRGLRSAYATTVDGRTKNQTQWVMTRMQMLDRRRKDEDNVWSLVVHRGGGHTAWNQAMTDLFIRYVRSVVALRVPTEAPDGKTVVRCIPARAEDGWLYDADIKNPRHKPAPYAAYTGDPALAFWAPDEAAAMAIWNDHQAEAWSHPDPTAGQPVEERFGPPPILKDWIDAPPPPALTWAGGDGAWDAEAKNWRDDGKPVAWDATRQALFKEGGGAVTLPEGRTTTGLGLGDGYTLDCGAERLNVRWNARIEKDATLRVRIHPKSPRGIGRGAMVTVEGNAEVGGTLVVEAEGELKEGDYGVFAVQGVRTGDFAKVAVPEPYVGGWKGGAFYLTVPHVPTAQELRKKAEAEARKQETRVRRMFGLPGGEKPGDPPDAPELGLELE